MTVPVQDLEATYACSGGATYVYDWKILSDAHLLVTRVEADGAQVTLELTTDYSVSGVGDPGGGSITTEESYSDGTITIRSAIPISQDEAFASAGALPSTRVEAALDKMTRILQQFKVDLDAVNLILPWRGEWATATAYATRDIAVVEASGSVYVCLIAHTSGTFSTDLAAGKWGIVLSVDAAVAAQAAAEAAQALAEAAQAAAEAAQVLAQGAQTGAQLAETGALAAQLAAETAVDPTQHTFSAGGSAGTDVVGVDIKIVGGMPNLLLNSAFQVNQDGYASGATLATGAYGHDGWKAATGGTYTYDADGKITLDSDVVLGQKTDDMLALGGGTFPAEMTFSIAEGAIEFFNGVEWVIVTPSTPHTFDYSSSTNGGWVAFRKNAQTGIMRGPKLELGSSATPWVRPQITEEAMRCFNYYWFPDDFISLVGCFTSATEAVFQEVMWPVEMRTIPTITFSSTTINASGSASGSFGFSGDVSRKKSGAATLPRTGATQYSAAQVMVIGFKANARY